MIFFIRVCVLALGSTPGQVLPEMSIVGLSIWIFLELNLWCSFCCLWCIPPLLRSKKKKKKKKKKTNFCASAGSGDARAGTGHIGGLKKHSEHWNCVHLVSALQFCKGNSEGRHFEDDWRVGHSNHIGVHMCDWDDDMCWLFVDVLTNLLQQHEQGSPDCSFANPDSDYHPAVEVLQTYLWDSLFKMA